MSTRTDILPLLSESFKAKVMRNLVLFACVRALQLASTSKDLVTKHATAGVDCNDDKSSSSSLCEEKAGPGQRQIFAEGEWRKIGLVMISMMIFAHFRRHDMRKRWLPEGVKPRPIIDHPAFTYLLENIVTFGTSYLAIQCRPKFKPRNFIWNLYAFTMNAVYSVVPPLIFEKVFATYLYPQVPYFSENIKPAEDFPTLFREYMIRDRKSVV